MIKVKRLGNVYSKIYDIENLRLAHAKARRGKTWYKDVVKVDKNPDYYLYQLQEMLKNKTYKTSNYTQFEIVDKGKTRIISKLPYFPDRICQWAIMLQIEETLIKNYIYDTYASIPGRGIHLAQGRIVKAMRRDPDGTKYCLQIDVRKYFPTIDLPILKAMLRRKFKDPGLLWLLDEIIDSVDCGLPIGNYLSQYLANYYLSYFDHYIKEVARFKYYYRYMDDVVIMDGSKKNLRCLLQDIKCYLYDMLRIEVKPNWQIYNARIRGIDFAGYRIYGSHVLLRKRIAHSIRRRVREILKGITSQNDVNSVMSYYGWLCYCNGYNFTLRYIVPAIRRLVVDGHMDVSGGRRKRNLCKASQGWRAS